MKFISQRNEGIVCYPLTHPQKRVWYLEKIYPGTPLYNIGGPIRIKGRINSVLLENSINVFIKKNEGLRLQFAEEDGEVNQYIREYEKVKVDFKDFSLSKEAEKDFLNWVKEEASTPFQLINTELFYFSIFKISENDIGYFVKLHHLVADGWTLNIMTEQVCEIYMKLLNGEEVNEEVEYSYIEYIKQEKDYLTSSRFDRSKEYWCNKFQNLPEGSFYKSSENIEGQRKNFLIDISKSAQIKEFIANRNHSLNTFFIAIISIYLHKVYGKEDVVVGTPVLNRSGKQQKKIVGMFTSTMPFSIKVDPNESVICFLKRVKHELMNCYFNQKYPYDLLVQDLELNKNGLDGLFNICVNYYNTRLNTDLDGKPIENMEFYNGYQMYSLQLIIKDWSVEGSLMLDFDYKINDYTESQIQNIYKRMSYLIETILNNPDEKISELWLFSEVEKNQLIYEFNSTRNDYPREKTVYKLFEEQVERTPDKVAVSFEKQVLTYLQLNEKANQLARFLRCKGVDREKIVGIQTTHSLEMLIGILAVMKAGGAYLPFDAECPNDRVKYVLEDSKTEILLINSGIHGEIDFNGQVINLDDDSVYLGDKSNLKISNKPNDLVYVIYTSGSTGNPKGTMIEHRGLVNYIWWAMQMYVKQQDEVFALYSSMAFDLTVTSVFTPLICGCRIKVYKDDKEEFVLYRIMRENNSSVVKLTPSHLLLLKDFDITKSSVKRFIVGGEDLKVSLAESIHKKFGGNIEIYNEYGPTETVVGCMIHKYDLEKDIALSVPIGVPANNIQIYILDKYLKPLPEGIIGEMYISGDCVSRGYINRPELTENLFISNPFINGEKMYKTGDLARHLDNKKIEYIGRVDHQVKIRGYRIELGEIEGRIFEYGTIDNAVVVALSDFVGGKYLCAYIKAKEDTSIPELQDYLLKYLPEYMMPQCYVFMDEIPLTSNGKVNKRLLPAPNIDRDEASNNVAPSNDVEKKLMDIVNQVLNNNTIGINNNFYHLGGDSIKAIQISSKLNDIGLKLRVKDILSFPIFADMATHIETSLGSSLEFQQPCTGTIINTPVVSWFFSQKFKNVNHYNQSVMLDITMEIGMETLGKVFNILIGHHDSLRINFNPKTGELYYNDKYLNEFFRVGTCNLSTCSKVEQDIRIQQIGQEMKSSFEIEKGILIKACLFDLGNAEKKLLITAHHLVVDGVSWRIFLEDFTNLLGQNLENHDFILPSKTASMQAWTKKLEEYAQEKVFEEYEFWKYVVSRDSSVTPDFETGDDSMEKCKIKTIELTKDETKLLLKDANVAYGTEPRDLLISAISLAIKDISNKNEVMLELEGHGRESLFEEVNVSRTVGWFTSIFPIVLLVKEDDMSEILKSVKEQLRKVPNKGVGFGIIKYLSKCFMNEEKKQIRFNYLGDFGSTFNNSLIALSGENSGEDCSGTNHMTCLIDINAMVVNGAMKILIGYSEEKFKEETMENFKNNFTSWLKKIIFHCSGREFADFTSSDFETLNLSQIELDSLFY